VGNCFPSFLIGGIYTPLGEITCTDRPSGRSRDGVGMCYYTGDYKWHNTTFSGPVRSEGGFQVITVNVFDRHCDHQRDLWRECNHC